MSPTKKISSSDLDLETLGVRVSVRYGYTISPFDMRDIGDCLIEIGYRLVQPLPPIPPASLPSTSLAGEGPLASNGPFLADVNTQRQFIGITGEPADEAYENLLQVVEIADENQLLSSEKIMFYEFQARYRALKVEGKELMKSMGKSSKITKMASKAYGIDLGLFSARLVSAESAIEGPNHLGIFIEPPVTKPESEIGVSIIYRNPDSESFKEFISNSDKKTYNLLLDILEG